ncbi:MAG: hypothetical protein HQL32_05255 [Planctomycetes bacterium]|nr:hypothetical protein [Planctomycetota bacterium]
MSNIVSLHPYFKAKEGKLEDLKAVCPQVVEVCKSEDKCVYLDFSFNGDIMFCREAYEGAAGVLAHLENAGEIIGKVLECADLTKIEVHGSAAHLAELKEPLKDLNPEYFTLECGI